MTATRVHVQAGRTVLDVRHDFLDLEEKVLPMLKDLEQAQVQATTANASCGCCCHRCRCRCRWLCCGYRRRHLM